MLEDFAHGELVTIEGAGTYRIVRTFGKNGILMIQLKPWKPVKKRRTARKTKRR